MSFNETQSRVVTGLLTGQNALRRHFHLIGLTTSPLCRCGEEDESSAHVVSSEFWFRSGMYCTSGLLFLRPRGHFDCLNLGAIRTLAKEQGSPELVTDYGAQRARF